MQDAFKGVLEEHEIPKTESLKDLIEKRTVPYWSSVVQPDIIGSLLKYFWRIFMESQILRTS